MTIAYGDVLRVAFRNLWQAVDDVVNVYHLLVKNEPPESFDDLDVALAVINYLYELYHPLGDFFPDDVQPQDVTIYVPTQDNRFLGVFSGEAVWSPWGTTDPLPPGTAPLVTAKTTRPRGTAKKFLPPTTEARTDDGLFNAPFMGALTGFASRWLSEYTDPDKGIILEAVVWARDVGGAYSLLATRATNVPAYQRRRKQGVGV